MWIKSYLMETYFRKHPDKRPITYMGESDILIKSTNLRRGYITTFEMKDNSIVIIDHIFIYIHTYGQI